jgi:hypothetical protein
MFAKPGYRPFTESEKERLSIPTIPSRPVIYPQPVHTCIERLPHTGARIVDPNWAGDVFSHVKAAGETLGFQARPFLLCKAGLDSRSWRVTGGKQTNGRAREMAAVVMADTIDFCIGIQNQRHAPE